MSLGGVGVISVLSNLMPKKTVEICDSFLNGDVIKARELQLELLPLINALFSDVNPIPVKNALNMMGKEVGPLRLPLCDMSDAKKAQMLEALKNYGIM